MSGSGGSFPKGDPDGYIRKFRVAESKTIDRGYDTLMNTLISDLLININSRDSDLIQQHLNNIKSAIESEIEGSIDIRYGGSVSKHTYVNGISDIDSLLILNNSSLEGKKPNEVLDYFYRRLLERLPNTKIKKGHLAVTIIYKDKTEIQILPAVKTKQGFKISSSTDNAEWSNIINPRKFLISLKAVNQMNLGKVIPTIKLSKLIISKLPKNRQISGYHTEALAVDVFAKYNGENNTKSMLLYFFDKASKFVLSPLKDKTGQSTHVDEYLGKSYSLERMMVSDSFAQISRKMQKADSIKIISLWKDILSNE